MTTKSLGEILIEQGIIDRETLDRALELQSRRLGEILVQEHLADPVAIARALKLQAKGLPTRRFSRTGVDAAALDEVLLLVDQLEDAWRDDSADTQARTTTAAWSASWSLCGALRRSVETLMLETVDSLGLRARTVGEQVASQLGKRIEVRWTSEAISVDRAVLAELGDMLVHLIRNAIDHGVEAPDVRVARGKSETGIVNVSVALSAGKLSLSVSDDGSGIDDAAVYAKAREKGLVTAPFEQLSRDELYRLLFTPGFSTSAKATMISGRGVGLDVVEAAALCLGGKVAVTSSPGQGSEFSVTMPLRMARISAVPLRAGREWIAVPASQLARIERVAADAGGDSGSRVAASWFGGNATENAGPVTRVELKSGAAWLFDEAGAPQDTLFREAAARLRSAPGVLGGVRLADGSSAILIDLESWSS